MSQQVVRKILYTILNKQKIIFNESKQSLRKCNIDQIEIRSTIDNYQMKRYKSKRKVLTLAVTQAHQHQH